MLDVFGNNIESVPDLWDGALDVLAEPEEYETVESETEEDGIIARLTGRTGVLDGEVEGEYRRSETDEDTERYSRQGLVQLAREVNTENVILAIEDFHNIDEEVQDNLGPAIKEASERDMKICVLVIKHRSDKLIDSAPDLRDRVKSVNFDFWKEDDLAEIGEKGFRDTLNLDVPQKMIEVLAEESLGSPYLMQLLCYNACPVIGHRKQKQSMTDVEVSNRQIEAILRRTAEGLESNYHSIFEIMDGQTFTGGSQRNDITFNDGYVNDVYRAMIRAVASKPLKRSIDQEELIDRINSQTVDSNINTGSIIGAYQRVDDKISEQKPNTAILDWLEGKKQLELAPGLILYLRWSDCLEAERQVGDS